jgi:WD40 repeat protein
MRHIITLDSVQSLQEIAQVKCGWITHITWSPDGSTLGIANSTGIRIYAGQFGGQPSHLIDGHEGHVKHAAFSPDGKQIVSVASDRYIKLWDIPPTDQTSRTFVGHEGSVDCCAFSPSGKLLASGGGDGKLILWDVETGKPQSTLIGHEREITSVVFGLGGDLVFSSSWDKTIRVWDVKAETGGVVFAQHHDWVRQLAINPSGTMLASASKDGIVGLWDVYDSSTPYCTLYAHDGGADAVTFSPDGSLLATGGRDGKIRIWHVHQLMADQKVDLSSALFTLDRHQKPVLSLAFNGAGTLLASGSGDNTVRLWGIY